VTATKGPLGEVHISSGMSRRIHSEKGAMLCSGPLPHASKYIYEIGKADSGGMNHY